MKWLDKLIQLPGRILAKFITKDLPLYQPFSIIGTESLEETLRPGDVLLVEGKARVSKVIKYLTQSTWSHAAIFVGPLPNDVPQDENASNAWLIEADTNLGVVAVPVSKYHDFNVRICRPVGLDDATIKQVITYVLSHLGDQYDMKNIFDLMRYLVPLPVPRRFRRKMIALGSGDPSRVICSSLIAIAFQEVKYPILPTTDNRQMSQAEKQEILHIRHHSLFAPRDFDLSPYFEVVKPTLSRGFDYRELNWGEKPKDLA